MSSDDIDAFRAELLRQKIIFEAELRRQRETFEERLTAMAQELADREADCRNLQAVVTILGKKVDTLLDRRVNGTPRRGPSPVRNLAGPSGSHHMDDHGSDAGTTASGTSNALNRGLAPAAPGQYRRNSPSRSSSKNTKRAPSLNTFGSRNDSPSRMSASSGTSHRPRLGAQSGRAERRPNEMENVHVDAEGVAYSGTSDSRGLGVGVAGIPASVRLAPPSRRTNSATRTTGSTGSAASSQAGRRHEGLYS